MSDEIDTGPSNLHDSADSSLDNSITTANESQVSSLSLDENPEQLNHSIGEGNLGENPNLEREDTEDGEESRETEEGKIIANNLGERGQKMLNGKPT